MEHLGFQSTETPIVSLHSWPRECKSFWVPFLGQSVHDWTAWVRQANEFGHLVKRFACGIVQRLPQDLHVVVGIDPHQLSVPAADGQAQKGVRGSRPRLQNMGKDVRPHVVDRDGRNASRKGIGLCKRCAHMQRALQSRAEGVGHRVELLGLDLRLVQSSLNHRLNLGQVRARSPLRHHASNLGVQGLVGHNIAQHPWPTNHCGRGVVARGLNPQNQPFLVFRHACSNLRRGFCSTYLRTHHSPHGTHPHFRANSPHPVQAQAMAGIGDGHAGGVGRHPLGATCFDQGGIASRSIGRPSGTFDG